MSLLFYNRHTWFALRGSDLPGVVFGRIWVGMVVSAQSVPHLLHLVRAPSEFFGFATKETWLRLVGL